MVYAEDTVALGERVRVVECNGIPGRVLSLGAVQIEAQVDVGSVVAGGELLLGTRAGVSDDLAVGGSVRALGSFQPLSWRAAPPDAPYLSALYEVFPALPGAKVNVKAGEVQALAPGAYGEVVVEGELRLQSGTYHLVSLTTSGHIEVDAATGPIFVHIGSSAKIGGDLRVNDGEFAIILHGGGQMELAAAASGTFLAPDRRIYLSAQGATYRGSFLARQVAVAADVTLVHTSAVLER